MTWWMLCTQYTNKPRTSSSCTATLLHIKKKYDDWKWICYLSTLIYMALVLIVFAPCNTLFAFLFHFNSIRRRWKKKNERLFASTKKKIRFVRCSGFSARFISHSLSASIVCMCGCMCTLYMCKSFTTPSPFDLMVISNELTEKPNKNYFQLCAQVTCVWFLVRVNIQ